VYTLEAKVGTLESKVGTLGAKVGTLEAKVYTLEAEVGTFDGIFPSQFAHLRSDRPYFFLISFTKQTELPKIYSGARTVLFT
jgi:hypothetical protein